MPYTMDDPPDAIAALPKAAKEVWIDVFNERVDEDGEDDARIAAWGAVKRGWRKEGDSWVKKSLVDELVELLTKASERERLREAQDARAAKYGIAAKPNTNLTPPEGYPTDPGQYADPVNYRYPVDAEHVQSARSYFNREGQREAGGYTSAEWKIVGTRIADASGAEFEYAAGKIGRKEQKAIGPDELSRMVRDSFDARYHRSPLAEPMPKAMWVKEVTADAAIVEGEDGLWSYPYALTDDGVEFGEPSKVEVRYEPVAKQFSVTFAKADDEKRLVYGIVLEPDTVDAQQDTVSKEQIERACHEFMLRSQKNDLEHQRIVWREEVAIVENYIAPNDLEFGDQAVKAGSWVMVTKVFSDDIWKAVKAGEITGYSIKGTGMRREMTNAG